MDRRRYVPSTEGLEGRALLATGLFGGTTSKNVDPSQEVPVTYELKEHRVERLPHFLELIKSGRYLPADTVKQLQADLLDVAATLHAPDPNTLLGFNTRLRQVDPSSSLSVADAAGLSRSFGVAVTSTGATTQQVNNLVNDMNAGTVQLLVIAYIASSLRTNLPSHSTTVISPTLSTCMLVIIASTNGCPCKSTKAAKREAPPFVADTNLGELSRAFSMSN